MVRNIMILASEWGYWSEELLGPVETFDAAGYQLTFATARGERPVILDVSLKPDYALQWHL